MKDAQLKSLFTNPLKKSRINKRSEDLLKLIDKHKKQENWNSLNKNIKEFVNLKQSEMFGSNKINCDQFMSKVHLLLNKSQNVVNSEEKRNRAGGNKYQGQEFNYNDKKKNFGTNDANTSLICDDDDDENFNWGNNDNFQNYDGLRYMPIINNDDKNQRYGYNFQSPNDWQNNDDFNERLPYNQGRRSYDNNPQSQRQGNFNPFYSGQGNYGYSRGQPQAQYPQYQSYQHQQDYSQKQNYLQKQNYQLYQNYPQQRQNYPQQQQNYPQQQQNYPQDDEWQEYEALCYEYEDGPEFTNVMENERPSQKNGKTSDDNKNRLQDVQTLLLAMIYFILKLRKEEKARRQRDASSEPSQTSITEEQFGESLSSETSEASNNKKRKQKKPKDNGRDKHNKRHGSIGKKRKPNKSGKITPTYDQERVDRIKSFIRQMHMIRSLIDEYPEKRNKKTSVSGSYFSTRRKSKKRSSLAGSSGKPRKEIEKNKSNKTKERSVQTEKPKHDEKTKEKKNKEDTRESTKKSKNDPKQLAQDLDSPKKFSDDTESEVEKQKRKSLRIRSTPSSSNHEN